MDYEIFTLKNEFKFYRVYNLVFSFILLIITFPFFLICFLLINIDSEGPVIFKQERLGKDKIPFILYKFRTMVENAEDISGPVWAQKNDPRITRLGHFLRRTRLDELPQLINVLRGEMNLVGCRPIREHFANRLKKEIENYDRRFEIKPGLTGWAQVSEVYPNSIGAQKKKFELEMYYLSHRNYFLDLKILFLTLKIPFKGTGL